MLLTDNALEMKYWIKTSQGTFGPYETLHQAQIASLSVPRALNEAPEIQHRTNDGKQMLFG